MGSVIQLSERKTWLRANAPLTLNGRNNEDSERKVAEAEKLKRKGRQSKQTAKQRLRQRPPYS